MTAIADTIRKTNGTFVAFINENYISVNKTYFKVLDRLPLIKTAQTSNSMIQKQPIKHPEAVDLCSHSIFLDSNKVKTVKSTLGSSP